MPDETGVMGSSPDPETDPSQGNAAGATDQTGKDGQKSPGPVPYERFKEINERGKAAEDRATRLETMIQQQGQQFQQVLATIATNRAVPDTNAQTASTDIMDDPGLKDLASEFGQDAEGQKAFRTLVRLAETIADKKLAGLPKPEGQPITKADVESLVRGELGNFTATIQTNNTLSSWRDRGLLDDNGLVEVSRRMGEIINADPRWGQAANQTHLLNQVYMEMLTSGKVKPGTPTARRNGGSPLQAGGRSGEGRTQAEIDRSVEDEAKALQKRFPRRFGGMTIDAIKKAIPPDTRGVTIQQTERGPVDSRVANDTYVHTRGR